MVSSELAASVSSKQWIGSPLVTRKRWAEMLGLPLGVLTAQCERGMWGPPVRIGKRVFVNVEAIRLKCAERAQEFTL